MTIDPESAAKALRTVEDTETRARSLHLYQSSSAPLFLWGLIWFAANLLCQFMPSRTGVIWLAADAVGIAGTIIAVRMAAGNRAGRSRSPIALISVLAFIACATNIFAPVTYKQVLTLTSLTIGFCYFLAGTYGAGVRFAVLGLILMAAVVAGYRLMPDHLYLWLGVVGGGSLCLAAFWMRKV